MTKAFSFNPDTLDGAVEAGRKGMQSAWIQSHLQLPYNKNPGLAEGLLAVDTRTYLGPVKIPLKDLLRVCGPEADMKFPETQDIWDRRINFLVSKLENQWSPPPFIVAGSMKKPFYLADGNHRLVALQRLGLMEHWAIFFFEDNTAKQRFVELFHYESAVDA